MSQAPKYRWQISDFAAGYDAAADVVHPRYLVIQDEILSLLPLSPMAPTLVVDLGGGSGRLMEKILDRWPLSRGIVVDMSEPFLALAERRLARFGERATCILSRLQDDRLTQLPGPVSAIVSMSAIHHLEPHEKQALFRCCFEALAPGGVLLNGDEVRPADDSAYLRELTAWADHMRRGMASGAIPASFQKAPLGWIERNVTHFGQLKRSGDDCHETIDVQLAYFHAAGFAKVDCTWQRELWAVLRGTK